MLELITALAAPAAALWWLRTRPSRDDRRTAWRASARRFLEDTNFRVLGLEREPLERQVDAVVFEPGQPYEPRPYVREQDGNRVIWYPGAFGTGEAFGAPLGRSAWVLELGRPGRLAWSLQERSGLIDQAFAIMQKRDAKTYDPGHPPVDLVDPDLRSRFRGFAPSAGALNELLRAPDLKDHLLARESVDLHVSRNRLVFFDPFRRNMSGAAGGMLLHVLIADLAKLQELTAFAFEGMAELLTLIARATQGKE